MKDLTLYVIAIKLQDLSINALLDEYSFWYFEGIGGYILDEVIFTMLNYLPN